MAEAMPTVAAAPSFLMILLASVLVVSSLVAGMALLHWLAENDHLWLAMAWAILFVSLLLAVPAWLVVQ